MHNKFIGDVVVFGYFCLLRCISQSDLKIGVNWYYTIDGLDSSGSKIEYLLNNRDEYVACDRDLYKELYRIVYLERDRTIKRIEKSTILPDNTAFYSQVLKPGKTNRENWYKESVKCLAKSEILFLDPDNNILPDEKENDYSSEGTKYAFPGEIEGYFKNGHSLIIYNHIDRTNETDFVRRLQSVVNKPAFDDARILIMKYNRYSLRFYLIILKPYHCNIVEKCLNNMLTGPWGWKRRRKKPHFENIELI